MNRYIFSIGLLFIIVTGSAQDHKKLSLGLEGGVCFSRIKENSEINESIKFKPGFNVFAFLEYSFNERIFIKTQFGFMQLGHLHEAEGNITMPDTSGILKTFENSTAVYSMVMKMNYLVNSWLLGYSFGERVYLKPQFGIYWGLHLNSSSKEISYIYVDPSDHSEIGDPILSIGYNESIFERNYDADKFPMFDYGLRASVTIGYSLNNESEVFILTDYYYGLNNIHKNSIPGLTRYRRALSLNIGFKIKV